MERMVIVSADGHSGGPSEQYLDDIDPEFRAIECVGLDDELHVAARS